MSFEVDRIRSHGDATTEDDLDHGARLAPGRTARTDHLIGRVSAHASGLVLRKAADGARNSNGVAAGADVAVASAASSTGQALPDDVRTRFERSLGADLSGVRIHTGGGSAEAAGAVGAHAYTVGQDIHFGAGKYAPTDASGLHLLAHEVAHTVQQQGGTATPQYKLEVSSPGDSAEVEADRAADAMVRGDAAAVTSASGLGRKTVFREKAPAKGGQGGQDGKDDKPNEKMGSKEKKFPVGMDGLTLDLGKGGAIKIPWGSDEWSIEKKAELKGGVKKEIKAHQVIPAGGMPGGFSLSAEGAADLTASVSASVSGKVVDLPPPYVDESGAEVTVSGSGELHAGVSGLVGAGVYVGIPPINIGAEGYLKISADAKTGAQISGTGRYMSHGGWSGQIKFSVPLEASITGTGGIRLIYSSLIKSGELQKFELVNKEIAKAAINCVIVYDLGSGTVTDQTTTTFKWLVSGLGAGELSAEEKAKYRQQAAQERRNSDGAEGSGPGVPPEAFDPADR